MGSNVTNPSDEPGAPTFEIFNPQSLRSPAVKILSYSILILPVNPNRRTLLVAPLVLFNVTFPSVAVELGEKVVMLPGKVVLNFTPVGNV